MAELNTQFNVERKASNFRKIVDYMIAKNQPFGFDIETGFVGDPGFVDKIAVKPMHPDWILVGFSLAFSPTGWAPDPRNRGYVDNKTGVGLTQRYVPQDANGEPDTKTVIHSWYIPIAHDTETGTVNADDPVEIAKALWDLLQTGNCVSHNASFELKGTGKWFREMLGNDPEYGPKVNANYGIFPVLGDSQLLLFTTDLWQGQAPKKGGGLRVGLDLKSNILEVFDHQMIKFEELFEGIKLKKASHRRFNILAVDDKVTKYACEDSIWCLQLWLRILDEIKKDREAGRYSDKAYEIEMELLPVVARMDQRGIPLDWEYMKKKLDEVEKFKDKMNEEILQEVSEELGDDVMNVNLGSPKQVAELLYDKLGVPQPRERGELSRSTAEKPLQSLAKEHKIVRDILTYRTVVKLIGSYLNKYIGGLNWHRPDASEYAAEPECVYPSHNSTGAISGRFSVDVMSYQQLPKPYYYTLKNGEEYHLAFREVIKAPENYRIVGFDYSQIQLRMMAGFAQEKAMLNAFARGTDIHVATASSMLRIPEDKVTGKQRSKGKTLNFSIVFGQGPDALANGLTTPEDPVTIEDAVKLLKQYYDGFPALRDWMQGLKNQAPNDYVYGLFGRRYKIWEFESNLAGVRSKGERTAVNEPIQGAEALYAKLAMVRADRAIHDAGLQDKIKLVIMVHDALEFFVHDSISTQEVIDLLGTAVSYPVEEVDPNFQGFPEIKSDWHEGPNLGALVEINLDNEGKISGYEMKMEVSGAEPVKWEGTTFDSVFDRYQEWRSNQHPEVLNLRKSKEERLAALKAEVPEEVKEEVLPRRFEIRFQNDLTSESLKRLASTLRDIPGPHSYVLITKEGQERELPGITSGADESRAALISLVSGGATMNEIKEIDADLFDDDNHPF